MLAPLIWSLISILGFPFHADAPARAAEVYDVDLSHTSVSFRVSHLGLSFVHGRFNDLSGSFTIDPTEPAKCAFSLTIKVDSIDTNQKARDEHLRGADFFDAKQFATITFQSTSVKATKEGYEVTGDFTMHGVKKPLTMVLSGGKTAEFPKGTKRIAFSTDLKLKRSDFGMDKMVGAIGDEIQVSVSGEGVMKK